MNISQLLLLLLLLMPAVALDGLVFNKTMYDHSSVCTREPATDSHQICPLANEDNRLTRRQQSRSGRRTACVVLLQRCKKSSGL